jgi:hypothetical protein
MKCPICKEPTGKYPEPEVLPGTILERDYPLYQFSYPGQKDYLPPRCLKCYERVEERRRQKIIKDAQPGNIR